MTRFSPERGRPFHVAVGCVAAGLLVSPAAPLWALAAAAAVAAVLATAAALPRAGLLWLPALAAALVLTGAAIGDARLRALDAPLARIHDERVEELRVHLLSFPQPDPFGSSAEIGVTGGPLRGTRLLMRMQRWTRMPAETEIGRELRVSGRVRPLEPARGGSFDFAAYLRRQGIAGELLVDHARAGARRRGGIAGLLDGMRRRAERAVAAGLPGPEAALARGMVLGEDEQIDATTRQDWRDSGLAHLLAVSGQNVMLLVALALPLLALARVGPRGRALALIALVGLYVPLAGAGPSLQRAGVMGAAGIAAMTLSRPASRWYALLLAAAVTLALNPRVSADPGWQLSFAAVAGILALGRPLAAALAHAGEELVRNPSGSPRPASPDAELLRNPSGSARLAGRDAELPRGRSGSARLAGRDAELLRNPSGSPRPAGRDAELLRDRSGSARLADRDAELLRDPSGSARLAGGDAELPRGSAHPPPAAAGALPPRLPARASRALVGGLAEAVAITVSATLATAPLVAFHFGTVPLAGLLANLLALPAVAPAMWLGMVKAALGIVAAVVPPAHAVAEQIGPLARLPLAYLEQLAERCADLPGGRLALPLSSPAAVCAAYAAIGVVAVAIRMPAARGLRPRRSRWVDFVERAAAWRRAPRSLRVAVVALLVGVLGLATAAGLGSPSPPGDLTVRFLDIGQGDATLIQHPDGTAVLFDGGPPEGGVTRLLRRAGVQRLAIVVATHASRDHHGGLAAVLAKYPVGLLLDGGDGNPDRGLQAVRDEAVRRGVRIVPAVAPMTLRAGGVEIQILSPPPRAPGPAPEDPNPRAVIAVVSSGAFDLYLSADAESESGLPLDLPNVEAMKVPHHGSSDPGLPELLNRLRPQIAGIEVGLHNTYGHPAPSTLAALHHAGVSTYRTDHDGTVTLTVTHGHMSVTTEH